MNATQGTDKRIPPLGRISASSMITGLIIILHLAALRTAPSFPFHRILFIFFFLTMVMIPGDIIFRAFFAKISVFFRILFSFLTGTAVFYLYLIIFAIFRWDIKWIGIFIPLTGFLVLVIRQSIGGGETGSSEYKTPPNVYTPVSVAILMVIIFISITALLIYYEDPILYTGDSQDGIAYIRTVSRSHEAFPSEFLYSNGGEMTRDIRKGLYHAMWGTINLLTGRIDTLPIWPLISITGAIFILLSLYCSCLLLFRSQAIGLLSSLIFLFFYHGGLTGHQLITVAYSFPFGKIFTVIFISALLLYLKTGSIFYLGLLAIASFCGTGTHIGHLLISGFLIFIFAVSASFMRSIKDRSRLWMVNIPAAAAAVIGINLPYLLLRYIRDYAPANILHTHTQGLLHLTERLAVLNPVVFYQSAGSLFIISIAAIFVLWKKSAEDLSLRLLLCGVIATLILVFNPLWVPFLMKKISYLLLRMEFAVPSSIIASVLLVSLWNRTRGISGNISRTGLITGWIFITAVLGSTFYSYPASFTYRDRGEETAYDLNDMYDALNNLIPPGSIIVSDPVTSYSIPAFADQFVICTLDQHSIPNDSTALERILDSREIFQFAGTPGDIAGLMEKYRSEYIVINGRIPDSVQPVFWKPDIESFTRTDSLLSGASGFEKLYSHRSLSIYRLGSDFREKERSATEESEWPRITADQSLLLKESGEEGIYIKDVICRQVVKRGDILELTIEWIAVSGCDPKGYYAYVRFNTQFDKGRLFRKSYGKIYRKILEARDDKRYRFRSGFIPFNGLFPPDKWPIGRVVAEKVAIPIPEDIKAGKYEVAVRLSHRTQYPNYTLSDLFTDDDIYQGVEMGIIVIE
ncbi:MAG: hypothetical protein JW746_03050 [Candidatus Krumholzibacteriota bacterium]|nr:hypothetical protein [Candidatus Krumholzibacteriota bacterium]